MMITRLATMALAAGALLSLAACDQMSEGFDKSFNEQWPKSFKEGCMKTAVKQAGAAVAEPYCSCLVAELSPLSVKEKMDLKEDSPVLTAAANKCLPASST